MNTNKPLHQRLREALSTSEWRTLDQIIGRVGTSSKSYAKVTLLAMPDVEWRVVKVESEGIPANTWRWEFRLIESAP